MRFYSSERSHARRSPTRPTAPTIQNSHIFRGSWLPNSKNGPIYGTALNDVSNKSQSRTLNLREHEIVLTFDDGPLGANTQEVLDTLQKHCVKATFFSVGRMAQENPKLLKELDRRGHTIGSHTWSHPRAIHLMPADDAKLEIEKGFAAVSQALGKPIAPFFRFPGLRDTPETAAYLASRNISIWSVDVISGDTEPGATSARITSNVVSRVKQVGKGIILFHDIKKPTADALAPAVAVRTSSERRASSVEVSPPDVKRPSRLTIATPRVTTTPSTRVERGTEVWKSRARSAAVGPATSERTASSAVLPGRLTAASCSPRRK